MLWLCTPLILAHRRQFSVSSRSVWSTEFQTTSGTLPPDPPKKKKVTVIHCTIFKHRVYKQMSSWDENKLVTGKMKDRRASAKVTTNWLALGKNCPI